MLNDVAQSTSISGLKPFDEDRESVPLEEEHERMRCRIAAEPLRLMTRSEPVDTAPLNPATDTPFIRREATILGIQPSDPLVIGSRPRTVLTAGDPRSRAAPIPCCGSRDTVAGITNT